MSKVRFTAFADLHHHPAWYKVEAPERLANIQERATQSGSDFIIHMGDLCHQPTASTDLLRQYRSTNLPAYHVLGNHEFDIDSLAQVLDAYRMKCGYYFFDCNGFRFVILDENYFSDFPGIFSHYSQRNYFDHPDGRDWLNPDQVNWFRETVLGSPYPCVVCSHATLEFTGIHNHDEMMSIIRQSQATPGRVMLCINGHYHRDNINVIENVAFLDLNSASFNWVPKPHHLFPPEWYFQYECVGNQITYKDPLSAIITIDSDGTIEINGTTSSFVCGVSCEASGNSAGHRPCTPNISSAKLKLECP